MTTSTPVHYDLIVIGTGAGGSAPALKCRDAGWKVAVVDDLPYGGTCALRGCDPKKVLVGAADLFDWHRRMQGSGLTGDTRIDWPALMRFKRTFTDPVPEDRESGLIAAGVDTYHGLARFVSANRVVVGGDELQSEHFVIATGAKPRRLDIPGEELLRTSTDFLELELLPPRVVFIGAGYIGLEFAHVAERAGASVTVLGRGRPLPRFDADLVDVLVEHTRAIGVDLRLDTEVVGVDAAASGLLVRYRSPEGEGAMEGDLVIHSAGRVPGTESLDVGSAEIDVLQNGAIVVNDYLRSVSNPRVYAAGDVTLPRGSLPLTPVAAHEGAIVASNLLGGDAKRPNYSGVASIVFTVPPLAMVGITERDAQRHGQDVTVKSANTRDWYSSRRVRSDVGMFKTLADKRTGHLLGAHLLGHHADETINIFALAIRHGLTASEIRHGIFGYPSSASEVVYMV